MKTAKKKTTPTTRRTRARPSRRSQKAMQPRATRTTRSSVRAGYVIRTAGWAYESFFSRLLPRLSRRRSRGVRVTAAAPHFRALAALLMLALIANALSGVGYTVAYFNDTEVSAGNTLRAWGLDFTLDAPGWSPFASSTALRPGDTVTRTVRIVDDESPSSTPFTYVMRSSGIAGALCDSLLLEAFLEGSSTYQGGLTGFASATTTFATTTDEWLFSITLPALAPDPGDAPCDFDFIVESWQKPFASSTMDGFHDRESTGNVVASVEAPPLSCSAGAIADFDTDALGGSIGHGQTVDTEYSHWGLITGVLGGGDNDDDDHDHDDDDDDDDDDEKEAIAYDSAHPSHEELGTPNEDFGGPGEGEGGEAGTPGENSTEQFNVLVITEHDDDDHDDDGDHDDDDDDHDHGDDDDHDDDGDHGDDDDDDADEDADDDDGDREVEIVDGTLLFTFDIPTYVESILVLNSHDDDRGHHDHDNDDDEHDDDEDGEDDDEDDDGDGDEDEDDDSASTVKLYNASGGLIATFPIVDLGENSSQTITIATGGVKTVRVVLEEDEMAVDDLCFTPVESASESVVLNEFLPNPHGRDYGFDFGSDSSKKPKGEWVEIYNMNGTAFDLAGWYVWDASGSLDNRVFITAANTDLGTTVIPANGWLVVYMNKAVLNNDGDTVTLFNGSGAIVDSYTYGSLADHCDAEPSPGDPNVATTTPGCAGVPGNKSYARIPDGTGAFVDPIPTPGGVNVLDDESNAVSDDPSASVGMGEDSTGDDLRGDEVAARIDEEDEAAAIVVADDLDNGIPPTSDAGESGIDFVADESRERSESDDTLPSVEDDASLPEASAHDVSSDVLVSVPPPKETVIYEEGI